MVSTLANPPLFRDELVSTADERGVLAAFLDLYRDTVVRKIRGLSDADAQRQVVPTLTTLEDLLKHLRWLEVEWFQHVLNQETPAQASGSPWSTDPDSDAASAGSIDDLVSNYLAACQRSRDIAAAFSLHDTVPHERMGQVSLRWIYVHMIEESARHAGHADVVRELIASGTPA